MVCSVVMSSSARRPAQPIDRHRPDCLTPADQRQAQFGTCRAARVFNKAAARSMLFDARLPVRNAPADHRVTTDFNPAALGHHLSAGFAGAGPQHRPTTGLVDEIDQIETDVI
jgi:hypothetical protein